MNKESPKILRTKIPGSYIIMAEPFHIESD